MIAHGDLAIIDGDSLIYSVGFGSQDVSLAWACTRLKNLVHDLVFKDAACKRYVGYLTPSGETFRHRIATKAVYKGTRSSPRPKHYQGLRDYAIAKLGFEVTVDCEADDAVGILNEKHKSERPVMIHIDKDLNMLVGVHMGTRTREWFEVTPQQALVTFYRQVIMGDRTDNIIGTPGVGKTIVQRIITDDMDEEMCYLMALTCLESEERVLENGRLCWMQTKEGEMWSHFQEGLV